MQNSSLAELEVLVGDWRVELSNAGFLPDGAMMSGSMSIAPLDDLLLVMRSTMDGDGPPRSVSVIGRNEDRDDYEVLYADERGVSRVYRMTFGDGVWTQERADPGFHQRFRAEIDGDRIEAEWSMSRDDGRTWTHDFDLVYTRS